MGSLRRYIQDVRNTQHTRDEFVSGTTTILQRAMLYSAFGNGSGYSTTVTATPFATIGPECFPQKGSLERKAQTGNADLMKRENLLPFHNKTHCPSNIGNHYQSARSANTDCCRFYILRAHTLPFSEPEMICLPSSLKVAVICSVSLAKPLYFAFIPKSSVLYSRNRESFVVTKSCSGT